MCAFSQFNIIIEDRQQPLLNEISEGDAEGYYDDMPELIADVPDLESASPILRPEDDEEQPEEETRPLLYESYEYQHQELMDRLYLNLRELYDDGTYQ
jgi:hypothetical protein